MANLRKIFIALDTSKDGFLSADELRVGVEKVAEAFRLSLGKQSDFEPDWEKVVTCLDVDNDGLVGFDEFVTAASDRHRLILGENHLKQAFEILDKDKTGAISLQNLKESFGFNSSHASLELRSAEKVAESTWDDIDKLFKEIDKNGDGAIDFEEFNAHMVELIRKGGYDRRRTLPSQLTSRSKPHDSEESKVLAPGSEAVPSKKASRTSFRP